MVVSPFYVSFYGNTPTSVKYCATLTYFIMYTMSEVSSSSTNCPDRIAILYC